ncbi:hypothetical protein TNIN_1281 [Trichonephila inaurata madagascariensis]|uniref:H/ACA ribonucleoprotein complex subunit n=1 Tax=Trichonephila inaurata madagascariensis TaxID=2747483 RepID=A0A8X7BYF1_9ARAC|nr:hypothetical protein TNIN_1281 [Trichonephila inaurata madagascariensis]
MSRGYGGRGGGQSRGGGGRGRGGGGRGRGGGGRGGGFRNFDTGPPDSVTELGHFTHACEDDLVCKVDIDDVPYFNAPIYFENKQQIGKIDEIFGPINDFYVSVKLSTDMKASSFEKGQKIYIDPRKLLPLTRFFPMEPARGGRGGRGGTGRGGGRGFNRGGRGGGRGGFNRDSGGGRGGFNRDSGGGRGGFNRNSGGGGFNRNSGGFNNDSGGGYKRSYDNNNSFSEKRQKF